jgi:hypothetical protein
MAPSLTSAARFTAAGLLAASVAGLLAACGTAAAPTPTTTVTVPAAPGGTTPASSAPASPAAAPAGPAGCLASGLQPQLGVSQGTAGTIYQVVVLTNTSASSCTLYGYPGVSFVTGQGGSQVGKPASKNKAVTPALVTLAPGSQANLLLAVHDAGAFSNCQPTNVGWLKIYPPGDFGAVYVHYNTPACANPSLSIMSVTAVRAGAGSAS